LINRRQAIRGLVADKAQSPMTFDPLLHRLMISDREEPDGVIVLHRHEPVTAGKIVLEAVMNSAFSVPREWPEGIGGYASSEPPNNGVGLLRRSRGHSTRAAQCRARLLEFCIFVDEYIHGAPCSLRFSYLW